MSFSAIRKIQLFMKMKKFLADIHQRRFKSDFEKIGIEAPRSWSRYQTTRGNSTVDGKTAGRRWRSRYYYQQGQQSNMENVPLPQNYTGRHIVPQTAKLCRDLYIWIDCFEIIIDSVGLLGVWAPPGISRLSPNPNKSFWKILLIYYFLPAEKVARKRNL